MNLSRGSRGQSARSVAPLFGRLKSSLVLGGATGALLLWLLFFFRGKFLYHGDALTLNFSNHLYAARLLREGELPLLSDDLFAGFPLHAESQTGIFYPLHLLYLFRGERAFMELLALHIVLSFFSMAWLLQSFLPSGVSLAGGFFFAFSGPLVMMWHMSNLFEALAWMPLVAAGAVRKKGGQVVALLAFSQILLASHGQVAFAALIIWLLFFAVSPSKPWGRHLLRQLRGFGLSLLLASVQLLPLFFFLTETERFAMPLHWAAYDSLTLSGLFRGLLHYPAPLRAHFFYPRVPEDNTYLGLPLLFLALVGFFKSRHFATPQGRVWRLAWGLLFVLGGALALGENSALYRYLFAHHLIVSWFRAPARFFFLSVFSFVVFAAFGLEELWTSAKRCRQLQAKMALGAVSFALGAWGGVSLLGHALHFFPLLPEAAVRRAVSGQKHIFPKGERGRYHLPTQVPLLLSFRDRSLAERHPLFFVEWLLPNTNLLSGIPTVGGYTPLRPRGLLDLIRPTPARSTLDLLSVRWVVGLHLTSPGLRFVKRAPLGLEVYENERREPKARLVRDVLVLSPEKLRGKLRKGDFSSHTLLLTHSFCPLPSLDGPAKGGLKGAGRRGGLDEVKLLADRRQQKMVQVRAGSPAYLVLSEAALPGWSAYLDGKRVPIGRAYGYLMAVCVPQGQHRFLFLYRPGDFYLGLLLSSGALVLLLGQLVQWKEEMR